MKIAAIFLNYGERTEHTQRVLNSLGQAGYPYDLTIIDKSGIAKAINEGLYQNRDADGFVILANDILMPHNWLKNMVGAACKYPNSGMIGIHTVEALPGKDENGNHPTWCPFGNVFITRTAFDAVGYFNEAHDPYGMQDSDYGYRVSSLGFYNYYLPDMKAEHIGHDCGNGTEYRRMKDEGLSKAAGIYHNFVEMYEMNNNYYLEYGQK